MVVNCISMSYLEETLALVIGVIAVAIMISDSSSSSSSNSDRTTGNVNETIEEGHCGGSVKSSGQQQFQTYIHHTSPLYLPRQLRWYEMKLDRRKSRILLL
ncbi:hypothetical protein WUBG_11317 [Wuchereria bancrofti]|uniref:Uncharacterized protein n=1 Tax=Wuchereria bancrofti TaxID=6293 RepID=J9E656_WUCBA|nr:hypothetical protein WUBG_11317 [Wuchereria bancrofti]